MAEIKVTVKDMKGTEKLLCIPKTNTINQGKTKFGHEIGRVWKYDGNVLDGNKTFADYEIDDGDQIIATNKVIGGTNK